MILKIIFQKHEITLKQYKYTIQVAPLLFETNKNSMSMNIFTNFNDCLMIYWNNVIQYKKIGKKQGGFYIDCSQQNERCYSE